MVWIKKDDSWDSYTSWKQEKPNSYAFVITEIASEHN